MQVSQDLIEPLIGVAPLNPKAGEKTKDSGTASETKTSLTVLPEGCVWGEGSLDETTVEAYISKKTTETNY